jgi:large subunit ribosomal protein L16
MFDKVKLNLKFKKIFKKKIKGLKFNFVKVGIVGIRALESARINPNQLEAIRRVVVRKTQRTGKFLLRTFIDQPLTKKSKGSRMGKGVGAIDLWVLDIKVGQIILEISAVSKDLAISILKRAASKLPMNVDLVVKKIWYTKNDKKKNCL